MIKVFSCIGLISVVSALTLGNETRMHRKLSLVMHNNVTVNVTVKLQGWIGVGLPQVWVNSDGAETNISLVKTGTGRGKFNIQVPATGYHAIIIKPTGFLTQSIAFQTNGVDLNLIYDDNPDQSATRMPGPGVLCGDVDNNNFIDDADLLVVINHFLATNYPAGDLNGDGVVDDSDLLWVINNFLKIGEI